VIEKALEKTSLKFADVQNFVTTGCGRSNVNFANRQSTEIVCQAKGAFQLHPTARTLINLGAQSSCAMRLSDSGKIEMFTKNDKCAAGSGIFLEMLAQRLESSGKDG